MIIETNTLTVTVLLAFDKPTNVFQDEILAEALVDLSEVLRNYNANYQEYL